MALEKAAARRAREEAEILGVDLARHRQPRLGGDPAHLRLGQLAEREAHPGEARRFERGEHVRLVLGRVGGDAQQRPGGVIRVGDPRVVTGRQLRRAQVASASSSIASSRTCPLQPTHGFGVSPDAYPAMNGSTTPARNSSRRSIVKCGRPIEWASARAWATAEDEQQLRSASFSGSAHSSSVTATVSLSRAHSSATTELSTPPLIATSVRAPSTGGASLAPAPGRRAEGPCERVGGELGGMDLGRAEAAEFLGDRRRPDPRRVQQVHTADERHRRAPGRRRGATPVGVEPGVGDPFAVGGERER